MEFKETCETRAAIGSVSLRKEEGVERPVRDNNIRVTVIRGKIELINRKWRGVHELLQERDFCKEKS